MRVLAFVLLVWLGTANAASAAPESTPVRPQDVSIIRDNWGIAHIYGKSDADCIFGMIYAQAEDDFPRIEQNYLVNLGWLAQADGASAVMSDLRQRLFVDTDNLKAQFKKSPVWLRKLMIAWADGLNFYLARHPDVTPRVIKHFEPWMALSFTEGSIGGDIEGIALDRLEAFYGKRPMPEVVKEPSQGGSNGFAIAPQHTKSGHAMLYINPHTSHYFRSELQMVSDEGLNTYGAVTWGQFFIYQGFNDRNGWMHTSNGGDAVDEYIETVTEKPDGVYYAYAGNLRKMTARKITIPVREGDHLTYRDYTAYFSHHGPVIRGEGNKWIAIKLLTTPVKALSQSYLRIKTRNYAGFYKTQEMRTDTSNNTVYADADGVIAYFHGNFIPKRDPRFDYTLPVDGSLVETEWQGPSKLDETIIIKDPKNGWLQNTNNWPFSAAGDQSPRRENFPAYMWTNGENPRGIHAVEVLSRAGKLDIDSFIALGHDRHLTGFDILLPQLFSAFDHLTPDDPARARLADAINLLKAWDHYSALDSVATSIAIYWGEQLHREKIVAAKAAHQNIFDYVVAHTNDAERLAALDSALSKLQLDFGAWQMPWGQINRFQRVINSIKPRFDDAKPSFPVAYASSEWGSLASFIAKEPRETKKIFAATGNSFVAAIEFGPRIRAKAISAGGESGNPNSPHFADQAEMFSKGQLRDVLFYREDVLAHAERQYHPGD
jgi:acyl-homoserine-lactone acylase